MTIKIKYHDDQPPLKHIAGKSDWIDLRSSETVHMKAGEFRILSLGVSMEIPKGYEAHIVPRSSTFKNYGILQTNGVGIIDSSYSGDDDIWGMPVYATRDTTIHKGDRVCQFRIMENMGSINFIACKHLSDESRGGFGSTGVK